MKAKNGNPTLRILYVIPTLRFRDGGPTQALIEMSGEMARRGHRVAIYTTGHESGPNGDGPDAASLASRGIELRYFPTIPSFNFKFAPKIASALRDAIPDYDVVHINSLYQYPSTVAAYYSRHFGIPYIIRPHGTLILTSTPDTSSENGYMNF